MKVLANVSIIYPYLKNLDFDLILGGNSGWILSLNYVLAKMTNKKLISIAHGNDFLIRNSLSLRTYFLRNTNKIIVTNNPMKRIIKKMHHLDDNTLEVIHIGLDSNALEIKNSKQELRKEFNIPEDEFVVLSVGRHVARKNFDLVIKAINEIKELKPSLNLKYYLIGKGEETKYLKNLTRRLELSDYVEFLGACDSVMRNKFYKLSDLFIMPSITEKAHIEGFGIVFLEANYFKIPVIGAATGGMAEAIIDKKTGLLVKPNKLQDLIDKILLLINDKEKRVTFGENGYKRVIKDFNWEKIIEDYIRVFNNTCKKIS
ncbi:MAG: glycosyltransferase family 4 protein [Candidatus Thorarchaeota archaeon]